MNLANDYRNKEDWKTKTLEKIAQELEKEQELDDDEDTVPV